MNNDNIKIIKLKSGEMFIGELEENNLIQAYTINVIPTSPTAFNIMLLPVFMPISKKAVDLNIKDVLLAVDDPTEDLKNQYIAARTNIVVANSTPKSNLIGA